MNAANRQRVHLAASILIFVALVCCFLPFPGLRLVASEFLRYACAAIFIAGFCLWVQRGQRTGRW